MLTTQDTQLTTEIARRFPDLHPAFDARAAVVEANRCLNCFDAPCMGACPTHIDVPRFIKKIASGNVAGSAKAILEANVLAASCSRVCPVEVLCEGACVMHGREEKPIEIGRLQRYAMETYYAAGGKIPLKAREERAERVACIGAGPASLACAAELRQQGFGVTIFDKRALPGGLNTYGVAEYKLRTPDSLREVEAIRGLGVEFATRDITPEGIQEIEAEFDAVFLGVGLGAMHTLAVEGGDSGAVVDALEFIEAYKTAGLGDSGGMNPPIAMKPRWMGHPEFRRVVVIGAGNTAIDAACAAKRLGAEDVKIVYRRRREAISAFDFEYDHALREGVTFVWETLPVGLIESEDGLRLTCVLVEPDAQGALVPAAGSGFVIECDMVIPAIGQSPLAELLSQVEGITVERGRVVIDRATGQTTNPRYFAGGDCVNGGREVVDAVSDGKRAAVGIAGWLGAKTTTPAKANAGILRSAQNDTSLSEGVRLG